MQPLRDTSAGFTVQRWQRAARKTGGDPGITVTGLKLRRNLGGPWFAGAQALGAATGGAGAFSVGLMGLGVATRPASAPGLRFGAELSAGAAGGGGIDNAVARCPGAGLGRAGRGRYGRVELGLARSRAPRENCRRRWSNCPG